MKNSSPVRDWAGDLLLVFNPAETLPPGRMGSTWKVAKQTTTASLYRTNQADQWRGAPLTVWQDEYMEYWLLGEIWGERSSENPANWPGHFILVGYEPGNKHWHIWTDRCGTFHACYAVEVQIRALGTYSPSVAYFTNRTLDTQALTGFFNWGFFPADRTYFEEVKMLRPSNHLEVDVHGKKIKLEHTWQWHHEPNKSRSFSQTVDEFAAIFHRVIQEQTNQRRVAFPISGGLDSRSTIASLSEGNEQHLRWTYSYGYLSDSIETRIARKIATTRNLPFEAYNISPYLFDRLPTILESIEGFQDVTQCRQAFVIDELAAHSDYVMAAHWGDVWLDDIGTKAYPRMEVVEFALRKFSKNGTWLTKTILRPLAPGLDAHNFLPEMLRSELEMLAMISDPDFMLKALKTETWSFRWTTASIRMYQPGAFPLLPFYDPRLVDFFCTVPTDYVAGRRLQIEYLKRYAPDLARIPWQVYDANLYWYKYFNSLLIPKRAAKKIYRRLSGKPVLQRNWEVQFLSPGGKENLQQHLLSHGLRILDYVEAKEIQTLLEVFYINPQPAEAYTICMLLTFAAWLERYG